MSTRHFLLGALFSALFFGASAQETQWKLDWMDDFNGPELDTTVWSPIKRGAADWNNTMKDEPRLFEFRRRMHRTQRACCQTTKKPTLCPT